MNAVQELQAFEALGLANEIRTRCAEVKAYIRSLSSVEGRWHVAALLERQDQAIDPLRLCQLLRAIRGFGPTKAVALVRATDMISGDKRIRDLTDRQRRLVVVELRRRVMV